MLSKHHQTAYDTFYESTHNNEHLDEKTELLVGLAAAIALDCEPCTGYYLDKASNAGIDAGAVSEVLAKVMAVSAGQKRLQTQQALSRHLSRQT